MAEFQEVMRQWVRVRKATASNADKENVLSVYPLEAYDDNLIASIERNVMKWAAEHPEPVYPTWAEYLYSIDVIISDQPFPNLNIPVYVYQANAKMFEPIPADIAQKLGVEPKEAR